MQQGVSVLSSSGLVHSTMRFLIIASAFLACAVAKPGALAGHGASLDLGHDAAHGVPLGHTQATPTISSGDLHGAAINAHVEDSDHARQTLDATREHHDQVNEAQIEAANAAQDHAWLAVDAAKTAQAQADGAAAEVATQVARQLAGHGGSVYAGHAGLAGSLTPGYAGLGDQAVSNQSLTQTHPAPVASAVYTAPLNAGYSGLAGSHINTGYSGLTAPLTSGYSGLAAPLTSGYSGLAAPLTSGYSGLAAPLTSGYSGLAAPLTSGYSGLAAPLTSGYSGLAAPLTSGYSGLAAPLTAGYSGRAAPLTAGYSGLDYAGAYGISSQSVATQSLSQTHPPQSYLAAAPYSAAHGYDALGYSGLSGVSYSHGRAHGW